MDCEKIFKRFLCVAPKKYCCVEEYPSVSFKMLFIYFNLLDVFIVIVVYCLFRFIVGCQLFNISLNCKEW